MNKPEQVKCLQYAETVSMPVLLSLIVEHSPLLYSMFELCLHSELRFDVPFRIVWRAAKTSKLSTELSGNSLSYTMWMGWIIISGQILCEWVDTYLAPLISSNNLFTCEYPTWYGLVVEWLAGQSFPCHWLSCTIASFFGFRSPLLFTLILLGIEHQDNEGHTILPSFLCA